MLKFSCMPSNLVIPNHPSFKLLLEDATMEYGYKNEGPILLSCDVDLLYNVLAEIERNTV